MEPTHEMLRKTSIELRIRLLPDGVYRIRILKHVEPDESGEDRTVPLGVVKIDFLSDLPNALDKWVQYCTSLGKGF